MKKLALLLCVALTLSMTFIGCGKEKPKPDTAPTASQAETTPTETKKTPTTPAEINAHNLQIDEATMSLVQFDPPAAGAKTATIKTTAGDIKMVLYPDAAPKAVENFIALAEKGYYNGLKFYEVMPNILIGSGDPDQNGSGGKSASGEVFADEYSLNLWHFNGAVAMDNGGAKDQNGSRFYIVQNNRISDELADKMFDGGYPEKVVQKYLDVGGVPNYDYKDTVFGQVTSGLDIVEKIANSPRDKNNKPTDDIAITAVEIGTV